MNFGVDPNIVTFSPVEFWNELGVDYDDLSKDASATGGRAVTRLFHRLVEKGDQWRIVFRNVLDLPYDDIKTCLQIIYAQKKGDFIDVLATLALANKVGERTRLIGVFERVCTGLQELFRSFPSVDLAVMVFCIYHVNPKEGKRFRSRNRIEQYGATTHEDIKRLMDEWQLGKGRKGTLHLWWSKYEADILKMAFRKQRKGTTPLQLLHKNEFIRTASQSYLVFYDNLNELEIISNRVTKEQRELAEFIAKKLSGVTVVEDEIFREQANPGFVNFLGVLASRQMNDIILTEVHRRNAPLRGSPLLSLLSESGESIADALNDLESKRVPILDSPQDIVKIGVIISGVKFFIKVWTNRKGNVEFGIDRRYHSPGQMSLLGRLFGA